VCALRPLLFVILPFYSKERRLRSEKNQTRDTLVSDE
jgi:hypothetical protein